MGAVSLATRLSTAWETVVERSQTSTPFHTLAWKRAVEAAFGYRPRYSLVERGGEVVGGVPAFETPNAVGTDITNPFCEYGYPLLTADVDDASMLRSLTDLAGKFDAVIVKEAVQSGVSGYSNAGYGGISTGVTFRLLLDRSYAAIREDVYDVEVRRNVRLARESGIAVTETSHLDDYYPLYVETMERLGSPQFPRSFFESLLAEFGDDCWVLVARSNNEVVAGVVAVRGASETAIISNASDPRFLEQSPNHLLYAAAIEDAVDRGTTSSISVVRAPTPASIGSKNSSAVENGRS